jgi:alanyl-tRNA synthetase
MTTAITSGAARRASPEEDGDRFIEIWNLVFMQFEQFEDGTRKDLAAQSIDTGMGLERIGALLQGKHDNYDTDLMRSLIEASAHASSVDPDGPKNVHHRVIADHLRSVSFLIADGVMPSNEGRGYVLRRIMRRAMRHAHLLGVQDPLMYRLVPALVAQMGQAYPELGRAQALITETLKLEEERFRTTLDRGLKLLDEELAKLPEGAALPGEAAFKLYDTYGFPLDLTQDALREKSREVDIEGFDSAMAEQKAKARAAWSGSGEQADAAIWFDLAEEHGSTEFLGYDTETAEGVVLALVKGRRAREHRAGGRRRDHRREPDAVLRRGRRAGGRHRHAEDRDGDGHDHRHAQGCGRLPAHGRSGRGRDRPRPARRAGGRPCPPRHDPRQPFRDAPAARGAAPRARRSRGAARLAQRARPAALRLQPRQGAEHRRNGARGAGGERFHPPERAVETRIMTPDDARGIGAQALFGEKYGDEVRVVSMGTLDGVRARAATGRPIRWSFAAAPMCARRAISASS